MEPSSCRRQPRARVADRHEDLALHHFRDRDGREIDFVIEAPDGRLVGIEVKASASVTASDFRHLRWLADKVGDRLTAAIVLYLGEQALPFGDRMHAAPVSALWRHATLTS
jgi:predicted AAA+ superfamily ATPase